MLLVCLCVLFVHLYVVGQKHHVLFTFQMPSPTEVVGVIHYGLLNLLSRSQYATKFLPLSSFAMWKLIWISILLFMLYDLFDCWTL